jgi:predicted negative regulator of RcsB-dependent stress response
MATYDLQEQEQFDELKAWWTLHGVKVTLAVVISSLAVLSWYGWSWWQQDQSAQASVIYSQLQKATGERDAKRTRELAGSLIEKFPSSDYAVMGALISSRVQHDAGDQKNARAQLEWVVKNSGDTALGSIAQMRLVSVLLDEGDLAAAGELLAATPRNGFVPRHHELRGDLALLEGKPAGAKTAYSDALKAVEDEVSTGNQDEVRRSEMYKQILLSKIDSVASLAVQGATKQ